MKTSEKPITKAIDETSALRRAPGLGAASAPPPLISSRVTPETNDKYPGMSGRTHGEMNDNTPARNAASRVTLPIVSYGSIFLSGIVAGRYGSECGSNAPLTGG